MNKNIYFIIGLVVGLIVGVSVVMGFEMMSHSMVTIPEGVDPMTKEGAKTIMASAPFLAIFLVPLGWICGTFLASMVATFVYKKRARTYFFVFAPLFTAAAIFNMVTIPSPWWMWAMSLLCIFPASLLGSRLPK